ncbi:MAG: REP-associated tyrosine transposase [Phycisphaerales bacterium]
MTESSNPSSDSHATPASQSGGELPKQYKPADHEERIRARWEAAKAFHADPQRVLRGEAKPYCIVIPPPNVTDRLHLGHALNNTLQDVLARSHRMMGFETLWMAGTDHAGIATQAVVERRLKKDEGITRQQLGREKFVEKVQAFKDEYERIITDQLKLMGCSCDWDRQRFTMDDVCARAVREAFFRLFKDGLIYRGKRLVNWDPVLQTAVSDDECYDEELDASFYYLRYPLVHRDNPKVDAMPVTWNELARRGYPGAEAHQGEEQAWITVATTRPETYLGDTAVAVNPKDPRANPLRGLFVELPLVGRIIPILEDDYVVLPASLEQAIDFAPPAANSEASAATGAGSAHPNHRPEIRGQHPAPPAAHHKANPGSHVCDPEDPKAKYATGFLKVTPAHDPNDYELGLRHKAAIEACGIPVMINMLAPDGSVSDKHGWADVGDAHLFVGLPREKARKKVIEEFKARTMADSTKALIAEIKPYRHSVKHSDRSKAVIEPYLSDQWYVKVTDDRLAPAANRALSSASGGTGLQTSESAFGDDTSQSTSSLFRSSQFPDAVDNDCHLHAPVRGYVARDPYPTGAPSPTDLLRSLRNLPHLELPGATYFVTWRLLDGSLSPAERTLVLESFEHSHGKTCTLFAAVVMSNHVHAIVKLKPDQSLGEWTASIKKFTARRINQARGTSGALWQDERFDHIVRDGWLGSILRYCVFNPVEAGVVKRPSEYEWLVVSGEIIDAVEGRRITGLETSATKGKDQEKAESDGELKFYPARYAKTYEQWHDGIRDWCISRQLWWGHRVPVWLSHLEAVDDADQRLGHFIRQGRLFLSESSDGQVTYACPKDIGDEEIIKELQREGFGYIQDSDVLDTWFSSALWPMSTMGWPDPKLAGPSFAGLLQAFNPTTTLCTAREIITLWVSRMVMFERYLMPEKWEAEKSKPDALATLANNGEGRGPVPFRNVFIHAVIQDGEGRKMSKSLGNGLDPLDIISSHGSDAMRFTLCQMTTQTQDVRMPMVKDAATGRNTSPKFDLGRNFSNKLWNAARFTMSMLGSSSHSTSDIAHPTSLIDRWMLSRLATATKEVNDAIANFEYSNYSQTMYDLLWRDFCDWYLEAIKPTVANDKAQQAVLRTTLDCILRLLHPIMPYVTEAVFEQVRLIPAANIAGVTLGASRKADLLCTAGWPEVDASLRNEQTEAAFERTRSLITAIREVRSQHAVPPKRRIGLHAPANLLDADSEALVQTLAGVESITPSAPTGAVPMAFESGQLHLSNLKDAAAAGDTAAERERLQKVVSDNEKSISTLEGRLNNPGYAQKAPPAMVKQTQDQLAKAKADRDAANAALAAL